MPKLWLNRATLDADPFPTPPDKSHNLRNTDLGKDKEQTENWFTHY